MLFDFSLSRASAGNVRAGTTGYLDPFLLLRGTWDLHADRWSASVTLYQMATGELPRFGDGRSDPAAIADEADIDEHSFDASIAPQLAFFRQRYAGMQPSGSAQREMLRAWREAFERAHDDDRARRGGAVDSARSQKGLARRSTVLGIPARASELLERLGASKVRDAPSIDIVDLSRTPGVGNQTRRDARDLVSPTRSLCRRLAGVNDESLSVDLLVQRLAPRGPDKKQERFCEAILGLAQQLLSTGEQERGRMEAVGDMAERLGSTPREAASAIEVARGRWLRTPALTTVRRDIEQRLPREGRVLTVDELGPRPC